MAQFVRITLALLTGLAWSVAARAQDAPMDAAAGEIAGALVKAKQQSVIVFDFYQQDHRYTALGQKLADEFSDALAEANTELRVVQRGRIAEAAAGEKYSPEVVHLPVFDVDLARATKASAYVDAQVSDTPDGETILVRVITISDPRNVLAKAQFFVARSDEVTLLLSKTIVDAPAHAYLDATDKTYTEPKCLHCPRADYTQAAQDARVQGTVTLSAVVGVDGRLTGIRALKPLPLGLTDAAINTVKRWKLSPALTPDGRPVAVSQIIEVTFQLY